MDRRITLQNYTTAANSLGQNVITYGTLATVWANVSFKKGKEGNDSDSEYPSRPVTFTIRFRDDVGNDDRIVWDGDVYEIISVHEVGYVRERWLEITAELKGRQDG
jgi:SPP1 family predicted phage head-tail adaptor